MNRLAPIALWLACACSDSVAPSDAATTNDAATEAPLACAIDGTWTGEIDNENFPSGTGAMTLVVASDLASSTVVFGNTPPPPAPTDPNGVYPPGLSQGQLQMPAPNDYVEGFVYAAANPTFDGTNLALSVASTEVFQAYCALQPETWADGADGGAPYACLPPWGFFCNGQTETCVSTNPNDSSQTITYSVEKQDLCSPGGTCVCDATACNAQSVVDITFALACTGNALDGTMTGALGNHAVHLAR
jgi:hypothetical protein